MSWSMAMRDLRRHPERRGEVREERLRATAGLRGTLDLSSWRGRSGRRYVVGVRPLTETEALEVRDAVIIAVGRDQDGLAKVVDAAAAGPRLRPRERRSWTSRARARGATELHVHRLAEDGRGRAAVVADLVGTEPAEILTASRRDAPGPGR